MTNDNNACCCGKLPGRMTIFCFCFVGWKVGNPSPAVFVSLMYPTVLDEKFWTKASGLDLTWLHEVAREYCSWRFGKAVVSWLFQCGPSVFRRAAIKQSNSISWLWFWETKSRRKWKTSDCSQTEVKKCPVHLHLSCSIFHIHLRSTYVTNASLCSPNGNARPNNDSTRMLQHFQPVNA